MPRLPEPSRPDVCDSCGRERPLYRLYGRGEDHVHRCRDCLRAAFVGGRDDPIVVPQQPDFRQERDEARSWARELWVLAGDPWLRNHPEMGLPPDWLTIPEKAAAVDRQLAAGHDGPIPEHILEEARREWDLADADWMAGAAERVSSLERELAAVRAELTAAVRERDETVASLRIAEESVVRQKALVEAATEMIEEARRWARSLWADGPASEEPVVLNEPEFAPAWLTADGPRHTARPPSTPGGVVPDEAAHELRLAALDRWIADVEAEWGPITAEDMATAAQRLRDRARPED